MSQKTKLGSVEIDFGARCVFGRLAETTAFKKERKKLCFLCFSSQLKYRKDLNKMKGSSHFHSLTSEDNLALMNARRINKLVSEVSRSLGLMPSRRRDASKKPCSASLRGQCGASVQNDVTACICDSILNSEHFGVYYKWLVTD